LFYHGKINLRLVLA